MDVYIFDKNLNFEGVLDSYISLIWHRKYSKCGVFELHVSLTPDVVELLKEGSLIVKEKEVAYIDYREMLQNDDGSETLIVKGKKASGYLERRIIWQQMNLNTTAELGMRQLINENAVSPIDPTRKIELMVLDEVNGFSKEINRQVTYQNLLTEIENIATISELGFKVIKQNNQLVFKIYEGLDRTTSQNINAPAIFSREFENVLTQEFIESTRNFKNTALIAGEGEGAEREIQVINQGTGRDRYEVYVDARDLRQEELTLAEYQALLVSRGYSKLAEYIKATSFDCRIDTESNLKYKDDFDLGDKVTCMSRKWNIKLDARITEIKEVYESDGFKLDVIFGNNIPTIIEKIKQEVGTWQ